MYIINIEILNMDMQLMPMYVLVCMSESLYEHQVFAGVNGLEKMRACG